MKIKFLGTSSGWPLPRLGCRCKICTSRDPKDKRSRPSILINNTLLVDCGPDFSKQFQHEDPTKISAVFITHAHPDHTIGLWDLKIYHREKKLNLYLTRSCYKSITHLVRFNQPKIVFISPYKKIKIGNLSITPFLVDHTTTTETLGFKLIENRKSFVYIPDFRKIPISSQKFCQRINLLVLDGSSLTPAGPSRWGHLSIKKSIPLVKRLKPKKIYYTHLGHGPKSGTHKELENFVQNKGGSRFNIAHDGLELTI